MPPKRKIIPVEEDKFVNGGKVSGLIECNFYNFLNDKLAALVFYYNPECPDCERARAHMIRASKVTKREGHAYAAVDCTEQKELCQREGVFRLPTFVLYTRGKTLSSRSFPLDFVSMKTVIDKIEPMPPLHRLQISQDPDCRSNQKTDKSKPKAK